MIGRFSLGKSPFVYSAVYDILGLLENVPRYEAKFGIKIGGSKRVKWFGKRINKLQRGWNMLSIK